MKNKGLTLVEIIVAVAIISLISVLFLFSYTTNRRQTELNNNTNQVVSILNNAKQKTLASENSSSWGVHFEESSCILFQGNDYSTSINKTTYSLTKGVNLVNNFFSGPDIIFAKVTGYPNQTGSITLYLAGTSKQKSICINSIGVIQVDASCTAVPIPTPSPSLTLTPTSPPPTPTPTPSPTPTTPPPSPTPSPTPTSSPSSS